MKTHQGKSNLTPRKEFEIEGVSHMRLTQFKNEYFNYDHIICADVFCGRGTNEVGGNIIEGSPIRLLNGFNKTKDVETKDKCVFWFTDVRKPACDALKKLIDVRFNINNKMLVEPMDAANSINHIGEILKVNLNSYLFLVLDPNGPKDFPKKEVEDLLSSFSNRIDVVPYISANSVNRCIQCRNKAGRQFRGWLGEIENFDEGFVQSLSSNKRKGWIRKPIQGDKSRWTMIPTFGAMSPKYGWENQGYIKLDSQEGKETIKFYCGGN